MKEDKSPNCTQEVIQPNEAPEFDPVISKIAKPLKVNSGLAAGRPAVSVKVKGNF